MKKVLLNISQNSQEKHLCQSLFFNPFSTGGFLMFSGGIEVEHWLKMGYIDIKYIKKKL